MTSVSVVVLGATGAGATARVPAGMSNAMTPPTSPVLSESVREYTTMTATRYQHHNVEDAAAGTYFYDCVGFVTYALERAAPTARDTIDARFSIRPGFVPSPGRFVQLFDELDGTQAGWSPVHQVSALEPGDVVAWAYDRSTSSNEPAHDHAASGHAFIVAAAPVPDGARSYLVQVWDSTGSPHGPNDTRRTNAKNLPGPAGRPSGLGQGTVRLDAAADGALVTVHWSPAGRPVPAARFAMGRPTA